MTEASPAELVASGVKETAATPEWKNEDFPRFR